jgi:hypothetical protein
MSTVEVMKCKSKRNQLAKTPMQPLYASRSDAISDEDASRLPSISSLSHFQFVVGVKLKIRTPKCLRHHTEDSAAPNRALPSVPHERARSLCPVHQWIHQRHNYLVKPLHPRLVLKGHRAMHLFHLRQCSSVLRLPMVLQLGGMQISALLYDNKLRMT